MYMVDKLNLKIIEVPENYYECSVCHEWLPESEFIDEGAKGRTRTNCSACYNMGFDEMRALSKKNEDFINKHTCAIADLKDKIEFIDGAYTKAKLRERFEKLLAKLDDKGVYGCQASLGSEYEAVDYSLDDLLYAIESQMVDYSTQIEKKA